MSLAARWRERAGPLRASLPGRVAAKYVDDSAPNWAVQIAWHALLAMFPILLVAAGVLGFALSLAGLGADDVRRQLASIFSGGEATTQVGMAVTQFKQQSGVLAVVGFAGLAVSGSALFGQMDRAFAVVYKTRPRAWVSQRVMSIGMMLIFTALIGLEVGSAAALPVLKGLVGQIPLGLTHGPLALVLQLAIGAILAFCFFAVSYFVVPNTPLTWRHVLPGALLAAVLLELVTMVFPLYVSLNTGIQRYGQTFALMFVLMAFFFFLGLITMAGVELNSVLNPPAPGTATTGATRTEAGM